jgi:GH24 family phage-related lysozyme (muramidase)
MSATDRAIVARWKGRLATRRALLAAARARLKAAEAGLAWARRADRHPREWRVKLVAHEAATVHLRERQVAEAERVVARHSSGARTTSSKGVAFIAGFEGERLQAYRDAVGVWTIGYGHTRGVRAGQRITHKLALQYLRDDLAGAEHAVNALGLTLTQGQFDALVSAVFNLGPGILDASRTLGGFLRHGDLKAAADALLLYDHAGGHRLAGLTRRRKAERALFLS